MSDYHKVAIFWDYENCSLPSNSSGLGYQIVNNISRIARLFGSVTTFRAYLDVSAQSPKSVALRSELQSSGVSMIDCPHNGKKDVVDKMVLVDMLAFAVDHPVPATIILITGDRDYAYAVSTLRLRKYQVILVVPSSPNTSPSLESQASLVIDWGAAILRTRTEAANSTQAIRQPYLDHDVNLVAKLLRELQDSSLDDQDTALHPCTAFPNSQKLRRISARDLLARDLLEPSKHCKNTGSFDYPLEFTPNPTSPRKSTNDPASGGLPVPKTPSRSRHASVSAGSTRARGMTIVTPSPPEVGHDSPAKELPPFRSIPDTVDSVCPGKCSSPLLPSLDTFELPLHDSCPPSSIIIRSPLEPSQSTSDVLTSEGPGTGKPGMPTPHKLNCLASPFIMTKPVSGDPGPHTSQSHTTVKPIPPVVGTTKTFPSGCVTPQVRDTGVSKDIERPMGPSIDLSDTTSGRSAPHSVQSEERIRGATGTPKSNYLPYSPPSRNVGLIDIPSKHVSPPAVTPFGIPDGVNSQFAASSRVSHILGHSTPGPGSLLSDALPSTPFPATASHLRDETGLFQTWAKFEPLVHVLLAARERGIFRPSRSTVALALVQSDSQVYQRAGVTKFKDYTALAEQAGIIELGGKEAIAWIALHPNWFGVDDATTTHFPVSYSITSPPKNPIMTDSVSPQMPPEETAIFQTPTLTSPSLDFSPICDLRSMPSTDRQDSPDFIPSRFQPLINVLIRTRASGAHQTLRSVVGQMLNQDVYAQAGVSGFKEYVQQAAEAQLIQFGGVGGHAWMCLHPGLRM